MHWPLSQSYNQLPPHAYEECNPVPVAAPQLVICNDVLAQEMGLDLTNETEETLAQLFSGNQLPAGSTPLAQAYCGHQFGNFTMLGDGRAHLIGEHQMPEGEYVDVQLKGSGKTPYARRGDGRAALGPMLREYIISEAMHALNITTARSLAVVTTGEAVMRETMLQGAIVTRIASSHIRVGSFEYFAAQHDTEGLKQLADSVINRHYPELEGPPNPYADLFLAIMERQITLVNDWLRVGFIHGVMNTDNMAVSGETIDYGPCAFMDRYDPQTVFSSIDRQGRYAYANQPHIAQWNLARLAEAMLPLFDPDIAQAASIADEMIQSFTAKFQTQWLAMMRRKLGMFGAEKKDETLIATLLQWMQNNHADYTTTFRDLSSEALPDHKPYEADDFQQWYHEWQMRLSRNQQPLCESYDVMRKSNPAVIPRNHQVEAVLKAAEEARDFAPLHRLLAVLSKPYEALADVDEQFSHPSDETERVYQTFCGT